MPRQGYTKYLLLYPLIVFELAFTIFPLLYSVVISFTTYIPPAVPTPIFAGLKNYQFLLQDYRMANAYVVTFTFVVGAVVAEFLIGLGLALLLNTEIRGSGFFRLLFTLPLFALPVALGYIFQIIFYGEGGLNQVLQLLGLPTVGWLSNPSIALYTVMAVDVWQWTPFCFLVLLAGLQSLPRDPYEAGMVDGASSWGLFRHVTLPMLSPVVATVLFLRLVEAFKVFDIVYSLTGGGPGGVTETLTLYAHRQALIFFNFGYSSTVALVFLATVLVVCMTLLRRFGQPFWS